MQKKCRTVDEGFPNGTAYARTNHEPRNIARANPKEKQSLNINCEGTKHCNYICIQKLPKSLELIGADVSYKLQL